LQPDVAGFAGPFVETDDEVVTILGLLESGDHDVVLFGGEERCVSGSEPVCFSAEYARSG